MSCLLITAALFFARLFFCKCDGIFHDPADFFGGAQHRPKLGPTTDPCTLIDLKHAVLSEIIYPDNGLVLDSGNVDIKIQVDLNGFDLPSSLHQTLICVCLSTGH